MSNQFPGSKYQNEKSENESKFKFEIAYSFAVKRKSSDPIHNRKGE